MTNRTEIHVVTKSGEKKVVSRKEYKASQEVINKDNNSEYVFDVDWYLSHGCVTLNQMIKNIEKCTSAHIFTKVSSSPQA